jgi:hypothetical protein
MNKEIADKIIDQILANPKAYKHTPQSFPSSIINTRPHGTYYYMDVTPKGSGSGITIFGTSDSIRFGRTTVDVNSEYYISRTTYYYENNWTLKNHRSDDIKKIMELMAAQEIDEYNEILARDKANFEKTWGL